MRIVVLDGFTLNPGDLSWSHLEALGNCTIHDRTADHEVVARSEGAAILLTNKTVLDANAIGQLPALKYIGVLATGYNVVDLDAASKQGIVVTNVPAYSTTSVAQMVFAHLLNLTQHPGEHAAQVRAGRWHASRDFCFWDYPLIELSGLTMGIVGLGQTGRATAALAQAFGMKLLAATRSPIDTALGIKQVDLETLFRQSDVVSLHCPQTPETVQLVNRERLALMKPTAYLINTGRGGLVDEQALADALQHDQLAGAGLDVLSTEPPAVDNPLVTTPNCYITPHIAWATQAARRRLMETAISNVTAFLDDKPQNVVQP